jgi:hypothetical protein
MGDLKGKIDAEAAQAGKPVEEVAMTVRVNIYRTTRHAANLDSILRSIVNAPARLYAFRDCQMRMITKPSLRRCVIPRRIMSSISNAPLAFRIYFPLRCISKACIVACLLRTALSWPHAPLLTARLYLRSGSGSATTDSKFGLSDHWRTCRPGTGKSHSIPKKTPRSWSSLIGCRRREANVRLSSCGVLFCAGRFSLTRR